MQTFQNRALATVACAFQLTVFSQYTTDPANVHAFVFEGRMYEVIKENRSWAAAATCAVQRGGKLAEINSQAEQDAVFAAVNAAGIVSSETVAMDGGGGSYLWLGGNDQATEGTWVWNGTNGTAAEPFWIGTVNGSPVGNSYSNWGYEPDNWNGQDGLGLAFTDWPLGEAGQWNDVLMEDALYFIVEYSALALDEPEFAAEVTIFPNPAVNEVTISPFAPGTTITLESLSGEIIRKAMAAVVDITALPPGVYVLSVTAENGMVRQRLVKE